MHLDDRAGERLERVVDRPAVVRPRAGVDDEGVGVVERRVEELDVLALVVRLPAAHLEAELARPRVDLRLEVLQRAVAVLRRVAPSEQVEVDAVEHVDAHGAGCYWRPPRRPGSGDELVERAADVGRRAPRRPTAALPGASRRTSRGEPRSAFLSRASAAQAASRSTRDGLRGEHVLDDAHLVREAREAKRRQEAERDGASVRERVARRRLERVPEGVAEVELVPRARGRADPAGRRPT